MSKHFGKGIIDGVFKMKADGITNREIAEHFGLRLEQIKWLIKRHNKKLRTPECSIVSNKRGRPRKKPLTNQHELELEIKRLNMENELLRSFLYEAGRRGAKD